MILRIEDLKDVCSKILSAVDANEMSVLTETLELKTVGTILQLNVTNKEYYAQVRLNIGEEIDFHATVNANLFLKLISQVTSETVELNIVDNAMVVKANGTYKFPLIFDGDKLLTLPEIKINNVTANFQIGGDTLNSILTYNGKEIAKGPIVKPVQRFYYLDNEGAITFTTGACVNAFELPAPIKILLNSKIVKLFRLFKGGSVNFSLGHDAISEDIIQTKVKFENDSVSITAILSCDDTLVNAVPVNAIRGIAQQTFPYRVVIKKDMLLYAINRILLFTSGKEYTKPYATFNFCEDGVNILDAHNENTEKVFYIDNAEGCNYSAMLDLRDLKATLETCTEQYIGIEFGDGKAMVLNRRNIYNVIPEIKEVWD